MKKALLLGIAWTLLSACTFKLDKIDGYRVWVGEKSWDWIDIGYEVKDLAAPMFFDPSPIKSFKQVPSESGCAYEVVKENSTWIVESKTGKPEDYKARRK